MTSRMLFGGEATTYDFMDNTNTRPCNILQLFTVVNKDNFQMKNMRYCMFLIFAQNIDCVYTLEPPHRGGSVEYPQSMF